MAVSETEPIIHAHALDLLYIVMIFVNVGQFFFHFDILPCTKIKRLWMCLLYILCIVIRQRHIYLDYEIIVTLIYMHIAKICLISCSILGI